MAKIVSGPTTYFIGSAEKGIKIKYKDDYRDKKWHAIYIRPYEIDTFCNALIEQKSIHQQVLRSRLMERYSHLSE